MKKLDKAGILKLCKEIESKEGEGMVYSLGSQKANLRIPRLSTGIEDLDEITGGGFPCGRVIEIFGAESAGKTSIGYHMAGLQEMALDIPIEGCVDCDTEFLTEKGWKRIADYKEGDKVLQYNADGTACFVEPLKYHVYDAEYLWHTYTKNRLDMCVSEFHNVVYYTTSKNPSLRKKYFHYVKEAIENNKDGFCGNVPKVFEYDSKGIDLPENVIRIMVAVFADGSFPNDSKLCYLGVKKKRKVKRIKWLLNECGIDYRIKNGFFIFDAPVNCKHYPKKWYQMSEKQLGIVLDEMKHWDGCQYEKGHVPSFCTTHKKDADFIQFAYTALGYPAYITTRDRRDEERFIVGHYVKSEKVSYNVCSGVKSKVVSLRKAKIEKYKTKDGKMYCFTMPSEMWVMRRNDKIIVTGNTFDAERAKVFGNRPNQLLVYRAKWGEQAFNRSIKMAEMGMPLIIIDSVPSMQPKEDVEKIKKAVDKDAEIEMRIGGIARLMDKYLPTLEEVIEQTGTTVIFINQIRDKMNAVAFGEQIQTPGGHKLKHSASLRIQVARRAWIEIPNKNPRITAINEKVGLIMKFKVVKSKVCNPMGECEVPMFFDRGFVSFDDLKDIRKELMKQRAEQFGKRYREDD